MNAENHILGKTGVLLSFQIGKKITDSDITNVKSLLKKENVDDNEFNKLLTIYILKQTQKALQNHEIPGVLIDNVLQDEEKEKMFMDLTYFASKIVKKIETKNLSKYYHCYIVNAIVNMLNLSDDDFVDFNEKFEKFKNRKSDSDNIE